MLWDGLEKGTVADIQNGVCGIIPKIFKIKYWSPCILITIEASGFTVGFVGRSVGTSTVLHTQNGASGTAPKNIFLGRNVVAQT